MRILTWLLNRYAIGGLMITSIFSSISALIILLAVIFNFEPYFNLGDHSRIGFFDFAKSIPVKATVLSQEVPDSSINIVTDKRGLYKRIFTRTSWPGEPSKNPEGNIISGDTIVTNYSYEKNLESVKNIKIIGSQINTITLFLQTKDFPLKLLFALPYILFLFTLSYCCWQLGMLLHYIQSGDSFENINYRRLRNTGLAIVIFQLILFILHFYSSEEFFRISFSSSVAGYRAPLDLMASPASDFSLGWLMAGCVLLIIAKAFRKGYHLQKEQELTV